jgi:hypothetical protein
VNGLRSPPAECVANGHNPVVAKVLHFRAELAKTDIESMLNGRQVDKCPSRIRGTETFGVCRAKQHLAVTHAGRVLGTPTQSLPPKQHSSRKQCRPWFNTIVPRLIPRGQYL